MDLPRAQSFFDFINERESIRRRKVAGANHPLTEDPILAEYKFTNVRRHHDRTSAELRDHFYKGHFHDDQATILMNCAVARYFGYSPFVQAVGWQDVDSFDTGYIKDMVQDWKAEKRKVFTGAYVITNQGISAPKEEVVCDYFLSDLLDKVFELTDTAVTTQSWEKVATEMMAIRGFGGSGFMTKEILLDTMYTGFWDSQNEDEMFSFPRDFDSWTPIGPGGLRGATRVLGDELWSGKTVNNPKAMEVIMALHGMQGSMFKHSFHLSPHDVQFQLCEFDKYERVRLHQGRPRAKYKPRAL